MITGIDPKVDYAFKRVFGTQRNVAVLMHVLNAILRKAGRAPITSLMLLNPFNDKETSDDKLSIVDVRAEDVLGRLFNIEMQMAPHVNVPDRLVYYWSKSYGQQLSEGEDYDLLKPTITVCFLNGVLYRGDADRYHRCYHVREEETPGEVLSSHLEIHLFELPKFRATVEELHDPLDKWLYFLKHAEILDTDSLPANLRVPEIELAMKELSMVTQSKLDRARYEERLKGEKDELYRKNQNKKFELEMQQFEQKKQQFELEMQQAELVKQQVEQVKQQVEQQMQQAAQVKQQVEQQMQQAEQVKQQAERQIQQAEHIRQQAKETAEQALAKGPFVGIIEMCQSLLQQAQTPREELLKMPLADLQALAEQLRQQVKAR